MRSNKIKVLVPFILLFALLAVFWYELFSSSSRELPSPLLGEPLPYFSLPDLNHSGATLTPQTFKGRTVLLNIWATWCSACAMEHSMLMKIAKGDHIPIYSIDYKDNPNDARAWLANKGNPYIMIGDDSKGDVAIDLGVYGTPETFVISPDGKIIYRHVGAITQETWDKVLHPIVKQYAETDHA